MHRGSRRTIGRRRQVYGIPGSSKQQHHLLERFRQSHFTQRGSNRSCMLGKVVFKQYRVPNSSELVSLKNDDWMNLKLLKAYVFAKKHLFAYLPKSELTTENASYRGTSQALYTVRHTRLLLPIDVGVRLSVCHSSPPFLSPISRKGKQ